MTVQGIVYEGNNPERVAQWCQKQVGPGQCNYVWRGVTGWHVTVATTNGHEILRDGDAVIRVGLDQLSIVRHE